MRRENYSNRGRGGRGGGRGRGPNNNRRRGGPRGPGRGRGPGHRNQEAYESGNLRERISVESGYLVLIDQFMLANPQFVDQLTTLVDEDPSAKDDLIKEYGGYVVEIDPGTYRIQRDPYECLIVIHPEGDSADIKKVASQMQSSNGTEIFIDTRCVAMIDRELLDDTSLIEKYQQLWFGGQEKACRDLLRDNGGAVRYGFSSLGDELDVTVDEDENFICLRPVSKKETAAA